MIDFLLGVPGKLKTLTDRLSATWATAVTTMYTAYTTARAAKLDNLDAAISTRAAASTALSSATWTATKAGYLDMAISGVCRIKTIQKVNVTVNNLSASGTATLSTAVTPAKAIIIPLGFLASSSLDYTEPDGLSHFWALTDSTTVTLTRGGASLSGLCEGYAQVIEFY